jgi:Mannitol-1-phosphate/altronate dehydrogenases
MTDIYGDLTHSPAFIAAFTNALNMLWEIGTAATLERYLAGRL